MNTERDAFVAAVTPLINDMLEVHPFWDGTAAEFLHIHLTTHGWTIKHEGLGSEGQGPGEETPSP